jgi:hypothetical protein
VARLKFEQLHAEDGTAILHEMVEMIAEEGCSSIEEFAKARGQTPFEVWPEFCAEAGFDECEPWVGYPYKVLPLEILENMPGAKRKLTGDYLKMWKSYKAAAGRNKN